MIKQLHLGLYLILIVIFQINIEAQAGEIRQISESIITNQFGKGSISTLMKLQIPSELRIKIENRIKQKFFQDSVYIWRLTISDSVAGYAILDNVYGKSLPITFLVLFDPNGSVLLSAVVKYREAFGGAVANEKWLDQFAGKNYKSNFDIGSEIDAISGATISVNSLTRGIHKLSILIEELRKIYPDKIK